MPKDPTENIARYKVRGGHLNEYEFQRNQEELANVTPDDGVNLIPGTPPEERANQLQQLMTEMSATAKKSIKTGAKKKSAKLTSKKSGAKKATGEKAGSVKARPTARKASSKKSSTKKTTRKAGAKKSGAKKSASKKKSRR